MTGKKESLCTLITKINCVIKYTELGYINIKNNIVANF